MGDIAHGSQDHFYPEAGAFVTIPIEVTVKTDGEPAEEATRAEAWVHKLTSPVPNPCTEESLKALVGNKIKTFAFNPKSGKLVYKLDLGDYVGKAKDFSTILVGFVFEKKFLNGAKKGTTEVKADQRGVILAEPAVNKVVATPTYARAEGKSVKLKVTEFVALVFDESARPPKRTPDPKHFPAAAKAQVKWRMSDDGSKVWTDLPDTGEEITFTTQASHLEKELVFEAYLNQPAVLDSERITATVDTRDIFVQLVDELGLPMANKPFKLTLDDKKVLTVTTDDKGCLRPDLEAGRSFELTLADIHEHGVGAPGKEQTTASGKHLAPPAAK